MTTTPNLPAMPDNFGTGLEEFQDSDAVIPRLSIVHKEARFKDNLTGEEFDSIEIIPLGLVRQRVLWHPDVDDGDQPMCKSTNNEIGHPNTDAPKDKRFPWEKAGFNPVDHPPQPDGLIDLPCAGCQLKEWGTHPNGKSPYCTEQWVLPVLYRESGVEDTFAPAIFTLQRSGVKAIRAYLTPFQKSGNPAFLHVATVKLELNKRGQVDYSTPKFSKGPATDQAEWPSYATQFMQISEFLKRRPVTDEAAPVEAGTNNANTGPTGAAAVVASAQDPWATQEQQGTPAPTPAPEPEKQGTPATPAPSQPSPAPSQPATQPSAQADDDEDLPF